MVYSCSKRVIENWRGGQLELCATGICFSWLCDSNKQFVIWCAGLAPTSVGFEQPLSWEVGLSGFHSMDFSSACWDRTRGNGCELTEVRFRLDTRTKFFTVKVLRHWQRFPWETVKAPVPGSVQGQAGWGFEQPGPVEGVRVHSRGVQTRSRSKYFPMQSILWVYDIKLGIPRSEEAFGSLEKCKFESVLWVHLQVHWHHYIVTWPALGVGTGPVILAEVSVATALLMYITTAFLAWCVHLLLIHVSFDEQVHVYFNR